MCVLLISPNMSDKSTKYMYVQPKHQEKECRSSGQHMLDKQVQFQEITPVCLQVEGDLKA